MKLILVNLMSVIVLAHSERDPANVNVGPSKGVIAADEHDGFKLSPEALKNFDLKMIKVVDPSIKIPAAAILYTGEEVNIFRLRDGFFKRIDATSKDLKSGDEIVVSGVGFLRIVELAAFGEVDAHH